MDFLALHFDFALRIPFPINTADSVVRTLPQSCLFFVIQNCNYHREESTNLRCFFSFKNFKKSVFFLFLAPCVVLQRCRAQ